MRRLVPLAVTLALLGGCAQEKQRFVSDAWVRLAAVDGRPAAGYFTLHGGPVDGTLVSVATDVAIRTEMHESRMTAGGGMTMDAIPSVALPAGQTVTFAPGGKHIMLFTLNPIVKRGAAITLTFTFADGERIQEAARVVAAGDPPPAF